MGGLVVGGLVVGGLVGGYWLKRESVWLGEFLGKLGLLGWTGQPLE